MCYDVILIVHRRLKVINKQLSLDDVAHYPRPGMNTPSGVRFTPDSRKVAYLLGMVDSLTQELWTYDLDTGERQQLTKLTDGTATSTRSFSLDEELRRERNRQRETGVTSYQF